MKKIKHFFWLCSGANRALLEKCPTEGSKYVGIGATVFFTGVFAALAGGFALFTVFDNYIASITFGVVWGLTIFNLDRYIVSSMRKEGNTKKEFLMALPRFVLAILISLVIAKPLEMKVFEKEIASEYELMEKETFSQKREAILSRYNNEKTLLNSEISGLKQEILDKAAKRDELILKAQEEADGTGGSMRRNAGPIYKIKKADADRVEKELEELTLSNQELISQKQNQLDQIEKNIASEISTIERAAIPGPAARMDALSRLTQKSAAIRLANWFIILLFIAIETAPVVVKLMSPRGPYDRLLLIEEHSFENLMYEEVTGQNVKTRNKTTDYPDLEKSYIDSKLESSLNQT